MAVEFDVLGSVEARVDGRIVDLGHARQRCVLAVLLVDANRVVSVDQLLERVWADRPPQRARNTLYGYVSRLRQALAVAEEAEIVRRSGGYVLDVEATAVDLHRFHDLAGRARAAVRNEEDEQASVLFGEAIGLWRGDAFAGLDTPWFNSLRDHLDKERTAAERDHTDVRLRCGHHTGLPAELSVRVRTHPLDERLAGQFILALYRAGRPADALGHYERTRLLLADELGCDPSLPLQRLHQQILAVDPALNVPAVGPGTRRATGSARALEPRPAPTSPSASTGRDGGAPPGPSTSRRPRTGRHLIGRAAELALLDGAVEDALAGAPGVIEVVGEPGIGKTRLLGELGERARQRGFVSLAGRSVEFDRAPYGALVDALDDHLGHVDFRRLWKEGAPAGALALLSTVFPALSERFPVGPEPVTVERYWFHRAVRTLLEAVSADGGLVVSLDDLQWTDEGTAELIDHLVRHPPRTPLLLALAYRPRQAPPRLAAALARAGAEGRLTRVELGPLSPAEGAELCGARTDHWRFKRLYEASGGNPFYLEALTRSAAGEGLPAVPADLVPLTGDLPQPVRAALLEELGCLSVTARVCTQAAAVLGDSFEADMLAVVAQTGEAQTLAALDEIAERDLVRQIGSTRQFRFRHPLVRAAVYQGAGAGWRIEAHTRAAEGLALHGAPLTAQASHVQRSARVGDEHAVDVLVRAARQVMTIAPATAAHWTREALRLLGERSRRRPELWLQQADALGMAGRLVESRDILRTAASLLPTHARDQRARLTALRATMEWALGRYEEATALLLRELADHDGRLGPESADLEFGVAVVALRTNDFSTAVHWGERALRSAERIGDPLRTTSVRALLALAHTSAGDARSTDYLDLVVEAFDDSDSDTDTDDERLAGRLDIIVMTGWTELLHERYDLALRHLGRGLELSRRTGQSLVLADLFAASAYALMWLGRLDEAATYADDALEAASLVGSGEPRSLAEVVSAAVLLWRGDFAGALKICEESLALVGPAPGARRSAIVGMLGQTLLLNGDPEGCVSKVLEAGGGPLLLGFEAPVRPMWFQLLTVANLALGDVAAADSWADRAAAAAAPAGPAGRRGFALLARAEVQLARQDPAAGPTASRAAAEFRTARMPLNEAMARLTAGTALAASGRQAEAVAQVERANALAVTCGALALCELADQEHRRIAALARPPSTGA
ncbi:BTAD domain-containing putative transcriptional regulator [Streptomyces sp. B21-083]|uniref:BTAD domain-containing putative transcriptional regulator n=1 Tax=Streptomyces sp. B21-083 TaxID=3039410 RepID=UPI002FEFF482